MKPVLSLPDKGSDEDVRSETGEVIDPLTLTEELDRNSGALLHREDEPALR